MSRPLKVREQIRASLRLRHNPNAIIVPTWRDGKKWCGQCEQYRDPSEFSKNRRKIDQLETRCKHCVQKYYEAHREEKRISGLAWARANRDRIAAKDRRKRLKWTPDQREAFNKRMREWARKHRDRIYAHNRRHRARKRGAFGAHFTNAEWKELCARFGFRCVCCGRSGKLEADHIRPLSRGGSDAIENIQPLCRGCNSKKHTQTIDYRSNAEAA